MNEEIRLISARLAVTLLYLRRYFVLDLWLHGAVGARAQAAAQNLCSFVILGKQRLPRGNLHAG